MYGYLYKDYFNLYNPDQNLLDRNDGSCNGTEFQMTDYLESNTMYVLVVTTAWSDTNVHGAFSIITRGSDRTNIKHIGMYM